jgi:hypothetical protein
LHQKFSATGGKDMLIKIFILSNNLCLKNISCFLKKNLQNSETQ